MYECLMIVGYFTRNNAAWIPIAFRSLGTDKHPQVTTFNSFKFSRTFFRVDFHGEEAPWLIPCDHYCKQ